MAGLLQDKTSFLPYSFEKMADIRSSAPSEAAGSGLGFRKTFNIYIKVWYLIRQSAS